MKNRMFSGLMTFLFAVSLVCGIALSAQAETKLHKNPKAGSIYDVILQSLKMIKDKKFDAWIDKYCHPNNCHNDRAKRSQKRYNLPKASQQAAKCIHGGNAIKVARVQGDPKKDSRVKVYIKCNADRMPVPSTMKKHNGKWMVYSYSW